MGDPKYLNFAGERALSKVAIFDTPLKPNLAQVGPPAFFEPVPGRPADRRQPGRFWTTVPMACLPIGWPNIGRFLAPPQVHNRCCPNPSLNGRSPLRTSGPCPRPLTLLMSVKRLPNHTTSSQAQEMGSVAVGSSPALRSGGKTSGRVNKRL